MEKEKTLSARQKLFCLYLAQTEEPMEAARLAGFKLSRAGLEAVRLLGRSDIREELERCRKEVREHRADAALAGLCRLAAGGIGDVARLVCQPLSTPPDGEELSAMDLFAVSELRRGKDGGLEVKLHDRLKALELLLAHCGGGEESGSLFSALDAAVSGMNGPGGGDHAV
jgi:hypothetical protein